MTSINELLPIGSIVFAAGSEKRLMIYGVRQIADEDNTEYDYICVPYPEGHMGTDFTYLLNHSDISDVVFRGYEDEERAEFIEKLTIFYET